MSQFTAAKVAKNKRSEVLSALTSTPQTCEAIGKSLAHPMSAWTVGYILAALHRKGVVKIAYQRNTRDLSKNKPMYYLDMK